MSDIYMISERWNILSIFSCFLLFLGCLVVLEAPILQGDSLSYVRRISSIGIFNIIIYCEMFVYYLNANKHGKLSKKKSFFLKTSIKIQMISIQLSALLVLGFFVFGGN